MLTVTNESISNTASNTICHPFKPNIPLPTRTHHSHPDCYPSSHKPHCPSHKLRVETSLMQARVHILIPSVTTSIQPITKVIRINIRLNVNLDVFSLHPSNATGLLSWSSLLSPHLSYPLHSNLSIPITGTIFASARVIWTSWTLVKAIQFVHLDSLADFLFRRFHQNT